MGDMAFGSRHCWGLALLLLFITQVMLSAAYEDDHYTDRSRGNSYDPSDRGRHREPDPRNAHDTRNPHDTRNTHDPHARRGSSHETSKEHHEDHASHEEKGHGKKSTAATATATSMLVGTSLMLYWI